MAGCSQSRYVSTTGFLVADPQTISRFVACSDSSIEFQNTEGIPAIKSFDDIERDAFLFNEPLEGFVLKYLRILYLIIKCILYIFTK